MTDLAQKPIAHVSRPRGLRFARALLRLLQPNPFARMSDAKLADHRWAAEAALLRASRCGPSKDAAELASLSRAMEREMRHRGLA